MINDESECEKVAKELNYDFGGDEDESDYPGGCYLYYESTVYFNKNFCGAIQEQSQPICGPGTKTSTSFKYLSSDVLYLSISFKRINFVDSFKVFIKTFITFSNKCPTTTRDEQSSSTR